MGSFRAFLAALLARAVMISATVGLGIAIVRTGMLGARYRRALVREQQPNILSFNLCFLFFFQGNDASGCSRYVACCDSQDTSESTSLRVYVFRPPF